MAVPAGLARGPSRLSNIVPTLVLGLLLVFRTNTAYDRFWEGRKIWGTIINTARNLSLHIWSFVKETGEGDRSKKQAILHLVVAFAVATKQHLRGDPDQSELVALMTPAQYERLQHLSNPPLEIAAWIAAYLNDQQHQGQINAYQTRAMTDLLNTLVDCLGACERILKTPLPIAYSIHLKQLLLLYCISLPFQLVAELEGWTGITVGLVSFTLLGIEEIGLEIENPFGCDPNDLPLDSICQTIQHNIDELTQ